VVVRTKETERRAGLLGGPGRQVDLVRAETLQVSGMDSEAVGLVAAREGIPLIELTPVQATLEEAFMEITRDSVEFHGGGERPDAAASLGEGLR
jgi:ABC-2 type transport system ATP-binding protein